LLDGNIYNLLDADVSVREAVQNLKESGHCI
jgi:hypothetical protein